MGRWFANFLLKDGKEVIITGRNQRKLLEAKRQLGVKVATNVEAVKNADVVLFVNDVQQKISKELREELLQLTSGEKIITVLNKVDLENLPEKEADVYVSALTGYGINNLFDKLQEKVFGGTSYSEHSAIVSNSRHYEI